MFYCVHGQVDLSNGLVAHYPMEGDMTDASGNGYDGNYGITNTTEILDRWNRDQTRRFGPLSSSDASYASGAETSADPALRNATFTVNVWFKMITLPTSTREGGTIIDAGSLFAIRADENGEGLRYASKDANGDINSVQKESFLTTEWNMATMSYDGSIMKAYLNGKLEFEVAISQPELGTGAILLGTFDVEGTGGFHFSGAVDDVRIYDRALSDEEVTSLFQEVLFTDFSADIQLGTEDFTVNFTDKTNSDMAITQWEWDFGDESTSMLQNPSHVYSESGLYNVSLFTTADGRSRKLIKHSYIIVRSATTESESFAEAEYYWDDDPGVGNGASLSIENSSPITSVALAPLTDGLSPGFHFLNIRAKNDDGLWSAVSTHNAYISESLPDKPAEVTLVTSAEYYFDDDPGVGNGTSISLSADDTISVESTLDVSGLTPGFHKAFVRVKNDQGLWSSHFGGHIYVTESLPELPTEATQVFTSEYYFDEDPGLGNGIPLSLDNPADSLGVLADLDVSGLTPGFHKAYIRVKNDAGFWSSSRAGHVYIQEELPALPSAATQVTQAEYFIGTSDPGLGQGTQVTFSPSESVFENYQITTTGLVEGTYVSNLRVKSDNGLWSTAQSKEFTISNGPISNDNTLSVLEDDSLDFVEGNFNYSSENGQPFTRIQINAIPSNGSLILAEQNVSIDQEIAIANLSVLEYVPSLNFVGQDQFEFTVGNANELSVVSSTMTIEVSAVNDTPAFTLSGDVTVEQDFTTTETVTVSPEAIPADEANQVVTYSIDPQTIDFADVSINTETGEITITSIADEFGSQEFTVTADDGQAENNTASATFTLSVNPANQTPVIEDQSFSIAENSDDGTLIGEVIATDPEDEAITFSILAGNDDDTFVLGTASGSLTVSEAASLDFEAAELYTLEVAASDGNSTSQATISISITDVNEVPEVSEAAFTVVEGADIGTSLGTVIAIDPEGEMLSWSIISGNTNDAFSIDEEGGITVNNSDAIDFETQSEIVLTVEASDGTNTGSATVTITITDDGNQAPSFADQSFSIDENSANETVVGSLVATDPEGDDLSFSVVGGNVDNAFALSTVGELTVADETQLDFEVNPLFELTVEVSDGDRSTEAIIEISLIDVEEFSIEDQVFNVEENTPSETVIGTLEVTNPTNVSLTYSLGTGNEDGVFEVDESSGEVAIAADGVIDFEQVSSYSILVSISDGSSTQSATLTIDVVDVDEDEPLSAYNEPFNIIIYPNPFENFLNFSNSSSKRIEKVSIHSANGVLVEELEIGENATIDLRHLNVGIYFIKYMVDGEVVTHRYIKNN